jgi:formate transporter
MADMYGFDAFSPKQIAEKVDKIGVAKARLPLLSMVMLGILAGVFIGLGGLYYTLVKSDPSLGFATQQVVGGLVFSLGLLLVIVAAAELLKNWLVVCLANLVGALGVALLVFLSDHPQMNNGAIALTYAKIAAAKCEMPFWTAFFRGVLCNVLVCMAVWMALAGRSVIDKAVAIVFPISAFVAAGFEHSIANMFFIPLGMMLKMSGTVEVADSVNLWGFINNLLPVILGNLVGGSVLVGLVYHIIYLRNQN